MNKNILIVRGYADKLNPKTYNLQEVGLGKEFVKQGYKCTIIYYTNECEKQECVFSENGIDLTIFWLKGLKILNNAIYLKILNKKFLDDYDLIISNEYNQMMTYLLGKMCSNKLISYHGPYKDYNKNVLHKLYSKVYDILFLNSIIKNTTKVFAKSKLSYSYLKEKGFQQVVTVGVGLDTSKFDTIANENKYSEYVKKLEDKDVLLYVGKLEERRNISFIIKVFESCHKINSNIRLLIIGNGDENDVNRYFKMADDLNILDYIVHIPKIEQSDLNIFYEVSDLFVFPTNYDIFGMVLLESLYFGIPIISSINGGGVTLINGNKSGYLIKSFKVEEWSNKIIDMLKNTKHRNNADREELKNIVKGYSWEKISMEFLKSK